MMFDDRSPLFSSNRPTSRNRFFRFTRNLANYLCYCFGMSDSYVFASNSLNNSHSSNESLLQKYFLLI